VQPAAERAPGLVLGDDVGLGEGVHIGAHVTIHDGTQVGERCVIEDGVILGKRPRLAAHSAAAGATGEPLVLEAGVTVCANAIVFGGARIGEGAIVGDRAYVRERARVGAGSVVGSGSGVDNDVSVGARVRIQTHVYLCAGTEVGDDVFVGPGAVMTNDNTMSRHPRGETLRGPRLRRACRVGGGSVLMPGVEIGEEAFVAGGAVVTADVAPRTVVMGVPARPVREVGDEDLIQRWR
jgi:acetyltransferase-like isoleucine patch superfamily enzyme